MNALRAAARLVVVATRNGIRSAEHYARRRALQTVTGEITLADVLIIFTTTWGNDDGPPPPLPAPPAEGAAVSTGTSAVILAACVLFACCLAIDTEHKGGHVVSKRQPCPPAHIIHRRGSNRP